MQSTAYNIISDMDIDELVDLKDFMTTNVAAIIEQNKPRSATGNPSLDEVRGMVDAYRLKELTEDKLRTLRYIIRRIEGYGRAAHGRITDDMIARARDIDITHLFESLVGTPIHGGMAHCPWHDDSTASFSMRRYNRYRCFSCDERGTSIDFYMKMNGVGFVQAVKSLCGQL
jgi:CHC2 zinc finger